MLRSFAYAAATLRQESSGGVVPDALSPVRERRPWRGAADQRPGGRGEVASRGGQNVSGAARVSLDVQREIVAGRWERSLRGAFLEGYLAAPERERGSIFPSSQDNITRLISLLEAEKVFYELAYELNNRPGWAWIPMRGISRLLSG
jgi:predicted trehalose synthase